MDFNMGTGSLIRLCMNAVKWTFKILMVGFKQGWGYLAVGFLLTIYFLEGYQGSIFPWVFTIIGLALTVIKVKQRKGAELNKIIPAMLGINSSVKQKTTSSALDTLMSDNPHGVVFGKKNNCYIIKPEELDGHVLVVGGVGSGKSSCIAIPTLRGWNESVFAIDIKGELYEKTKHTRPNIKVFNPLDESAFGYDPFFCLHNSPNPSQEARAIAQAIVPLPHEVKDPFWIENAQNIFTGAILHYSGEGKSFIETIQMIQSTPPRNLIDEISESGTLEARYCINSLVGIEDKTLSSIMAELSRNIVVFVTDKNLMSALSRENNITPDDLEFGNDVYINIPEHLLRQWKNLMTLIVNQFLTYFEQRSEENARPILFLLDEFPRLGKVNAMLDGLATLRSKKISICLIIQSLAQLDAIYGQNERKVISDTCAYKAILGATDADTQEYFSRLAGTYDKIVTSHGTNSEAFTGINKGTSTNTQETEKRIIKPHEFGMLTDIVLLTPFAIPLEKPNEKEEKSLEATIVDFVFPMAKTARDLFSVSPETPEILAAFCRVDKVPYYQKVEK